MAKRKYRTRDPRGLPAPEFEISGVDVNGEEWSESFVCFPLCPASTLDYLDSAIVIDDDGRRIYSQVSIVRFLTEVLDVDRDPEQLVRWTELISDHTKFVELELLGKVMVDLTEDYTSRPTGPRPTSLVGSRSNGDGSSDSSSAEATTGESSTGSTPPAS